MHKVFYVHYDVFLATTCIKKKNLEKSLDSLLQNIKFPNNNILNICCILSIDPNAIKHIIVLVNIYLEHLLSSPLTIMSFMIFLIDLSEIFIERVSY
jgi:hypothetical protein